ncbi:MAG: HD domain-containing protein [Lachnospiraceae bacterium]|nr:HD domain-containing protein [Lachnospiraceae bacterium]
MERINRILKHPQFEYHVKANQAAEADRRFCCHNMGHFLDVARIGMIINLEEGLDIPKDWIYASALLHDTGRHIQYEKGIPHEISSGEIAPEILKDCGFDDKETDVIVDAIINHRNGTVKEEQTLRGLLYRADKASRACFACEVEAECNWKGDKKNLSIKY